MKAIFKREFRAYFHTFTGCLFIGVILFITGIYVTVYDLLSGLPNITYALSAVIFIFIISVPILTMRTLAEERRQRTDQLILTSPVSVGKIVTGKFLALAAVFTIPVLVISIYPLILGLFGTVPLLESYVSLLAFYLYGLTCISIGIFASSLTESQVIAAVITFAALFLGYVMPGISNIISTSGNLFTRILSAFDLVTRFENLTAGTVDLKSILYYMSVIILMLFLTTQSVQKRRYSVSTKSLRMGAYNLATIAVAIVAAILLNLLVAEIPSRYTIFDVTANKLYSLTDETVQMLEGLQEDVSVYVLSGENTQDTTLGKTLEQYGSLSEHIKISYVDPMVNPNFHTQYTDSSITRNSVIVESSKRSKVIDYSAIYETSVDYTTYSSTVTGYDGEGQITSAVDYVTSDTMPKIYIIEGHGELGLETDFYDTIAKANIEYESINLLQQESVPEDAECIIINAPTSDFSKDDTRKVLDYLENGGNALLITTWTGNGTMENFKKILDFYHVSALEGMVLEGDAGKYYQSPFYLLPNVEYDRATEDIGDALLFVPYAQGLLLPEETEDDLYLNALLTTSDEAFARTDIENSSDYTKQEGDISGPFTLGVKAVKQIGEKESVALIFSSENIFTDAANAMVAGANMRLFAGVLGELAEETSGVAVPVKSYESSYLTVPQSEIVLIGLIITVILPLILLVGGFAVWYRRRKA